MQKFRAVAGSWAWQIEPVPAGLALADISKGTQLWYSLD
jgi:hypothetical protein